MKNIQKAIIITLASLIGTTAVIAAPVDIKPSKTKPDISHLKADPGCKYIVEYNEFMREYSVNHICNTPFAMVAPTASPTKAAPQLAVVHQVQPVIYTAPAPTVNNIQTFAVPAPVNTVSWGFALPSFSSLFGGFDVVYDYDFGYSLPIFNYDYDVVDFDLPVFDYDFEPFAFEYNFDLPEFDTFLYEPYTNYGSPSWDNSFTNYTEPQITQIQNNLFEENYSNYGISSFE